MANLFAKINHLYVDWYDWVQLSSSIDLVETKDMSKIQFEWLQSLLSADLCVQ